MVKSNRGVDTPERVNVPGRWVQCYRSFERIAELSPRSALASWLHALFTQEPSPQSFENSSPAVLHVLVIEIGTPGEVQIDADGSQPKIFSAQSGVSVALFRESIRNLGGDYGTETQASMRGIRDQPTENPPIMSAVPTAPQRYTRSNEVSRCWMFDDEEPIVDGLCLSTLQVVTSETQIEKVLVCALIVGPVLPELIAFRDMGHADEAGRWTHHAELVLMLLIVKRMGRSTWKGTQGVLRHGCEDRFVHFAV